MAFLPHKLNVLEQCRISLPSGSVPTPTIIPLSFFDLTWIGWLYHKPVYFYNFHHPKTHFIETVVPKIKNSLSLTLQHFYPLAGNLTWPEESKKPEIVCKDGDSVSLTVVQSDYDFDHLSGDHAKDVNEFDTLVPKFSRSMSSDDDKFIPLLALQITLFPDRGLSIGFNFHHVAVDGRAAANFIKSWATICKFEGDMESFVIPDDLLPLLDRSIVKDPKGLEMNYINGGIEIKRENFNMSKMPVREISRKWRIHE